MTRSTGRPAMQYIDYGLGVLDRRAFEVVPETGAFDLAAVYQEMLRRGELAGFEVTRAVLRDRLGRGARGDPRTPGRAGD